MPPDSSSSLFFQISNFNQITHYLIEGRLALQGAIQQGHLIEWIAIAGDFPNWLNGLSTPVHTLSKPQLAKLSGYNFHRGCLALARKPEHSFDTWLTSSKPRVLVGLHGIADPGNLGTVIRNAVAFGAEAILCQNCVSAYNRKAVRASATALFHVPVFEDVDFITLHNKLSATWIATHLSPQSTTLRNFCVNPSNLYFVLFGSEAAGLPEKLSQLCDQHLRIPMQGQIESLNVSCASAIVLHYLQEQFVSGPITKISPQNPRF